MKKFAALSSLCLFGILLALTSCSGSNTIETPAYQGSAYSLPATPGGRMCVEQCKRAREYCAQSCGFDYRACYNAVQTSAQQNYDHYVRERFATHTTVDMLPSDFEHPDLCNSDNKRCLGDCEHPYNDCYRTCGGTVTVTSSCRFLCFE